MKILNIQTILGLILILILNACSAKHEIITSNKNHQLKPNKSIYIALPKDGIFGSIQYPASSTQTTHALLKSFSRYSNNIEASNQYATYAQALRETSKRGFYYLVYPTILHWEDRATEWSGKPDKLSIQIKIVQANTGKQLNSTIIEGKSSWATLGGDHPEDLLQDPIDKLVNSFFR